MSLFYYQTARKRKGSLTVPFRNISDHRLHAVEPEPRKPKTPSSIVPSAHANEQSLNLLSLAPPNAQFVRGFNFVQPSDSVESLAPEKSTTSQGSFTSFLSSSSPLDDNKAQRETILLNNPERTLGFKVISPDSKLWPMLRTNKVRQGYWMEMVIHIAEERLGIRHGDERLQVDADKLCRDIDASEHEGGLLRQSRSQHKRSKEQCLFEVTSFRDKARATVKDAAIMIGRVNFHQIDLLLGRVRAKVRQIVHDVAIGENVDCPGLLVCLDELAILAHQQAMVNSAFTSEQSFLAWAEGELS